MSRDLSNNQVNGTIPSSIESLTILSLLYVLAHGRWKICAHKSSPLCIYGRVIITMYRNLANNHLESPLPSFLQTNPAIDSLDLRNNSFVREIRSQRSGTYHSLNSHLTHARRRARSRLGVTTSLEVVSVSLVPRRPRRHHPFQDGQPSRWCAADLEWW